MHQRYQRLPRFLRMCLHPSPHPSLHQWPVPQWQRLLYLHQHLSLSRFRWLQLQYRSKRQPPAVVVPLGAVPSLLGVL